MKKIFVIVGAILFVTLIPLLWETWQETQDSAVLSCVLSIHKNINSREQSDLLMIFEVNSEWRQLNKSESERLMLTSRPNTFDCVKRDSGGLPIDPWNNHFEVAVRRPTGNNVIEFRVWSNGRDMISGTKDDLVSPYYPK